MKKILSAIGIGSLMLVLLLALSFTSVSASETSTSIDPASTYTMFITDVRRTFPGSPTQTIYYNEHGWTGTLTLVRPIGNVGIYEGYVQCTGLCPMTKQLDQ